MGNYGRVNTLGLLVVAWGSGNTKGISGTVWVRGIWEGGNTSVADDEFLGLVEAFGRPKQFILYSPLPRHAIFSR